MTKYIYLYQWTINVFFVFVIANSSNQPIEKQFLSCEIVSG